MAFAQSPSTSELYSQPEEVEQYHAFMYSVPVLLCVILCISFYLLYLFTKKASAISYPPQLPPTFTETPSSFANSACEVGPQDDLVEKLPTIVLDEELKARDSSCSVCLGEFEMKEELIQVQSCKHIFHRDCIRNWLISATTCPLCRSSVIVENTKLVHPPPPVPQTSPAVLLPAATSIQLARTS